MIIALLVELLFMPLCAALTGLVVWSINRNQIVEDGILLRDFVLVLLVFLMLGMGVGKTDTVRMYLDPQFRLQRELDADPVYAAIKRLAPGDHKSLDDFIAAQLGQGKTAQEALVLARPLLTGLVNERMGFADQATRIAWTKVTAETLKELQTRDPLLCYQALRRDPDEQAYTQPFSTENVAAFTRVVVAVYESADRGMRHEHPAGDKPVEFNVAALQYRAIQKNIENQFGAAVANRLATRKFPDPPTELPEQMCAARIAQLDAILEQPQAMAATLADSVLR